MTPLLGHSITYRITVGPQAGRKVFTLQTLPASDEPFGDGGRPGSRVLSARRGGGQGPSAPEA